MSSLGKLSPVALLLEGSNRAVAPVGIEQAAIKTESNVG